jgi:hypothetical protein
VIGDDSSSLIGLIPSGSNITTPECRGQFLGAAIERHLLEQAAMFISPMSASKRTTDSSRTSRHFRKVPSTDSCTAAITGYSIT